MDDVVWRQVQYPAKAEPVGDPSVFIEPVFFDGWWRPAQEPARPVEYRHLIPSVFYQGDPGDFIEPVFFEAWNQPIQEPVRPIEYRYELRSVFFVGEPDDFAVEAVPDFGWFRPTDEPVRPFEYRYTLPSHFAIAWEEIISTDDGVNFGAWVQPIEQPVLPIEYRFQIPSFFVQVEPNDFITVKRPLKYLSLELCGGLSTSLTPTGDMLQISHVSTSPIGAPPGNKGVMFEVSGGKITIHVWDGSKWISFTN